MHNTLVFATLPLHSSVFYHSTERFVKFGAVLHHDLNNGHCRMMRIIKFHFRGSINDTHIARFGPW